MLKRFMLLVVGLIGAGGFTPPFLLTESADSLSPSPAVSLGSAAKPLMSDAKKALVSIKQVTSKAAYESLGIETKCGVIVDEKRGFVLTTRTPVGIGAVVGSYELTFAGGQKCEAHVYYTDPLYNMQILVFDPQHVSGIKQITLTRKTPWQSMSTFLLSKRDEQETSYEGHVSTLHEGVGFIAPAQTMRVSLNTPGVLLPGSIALDEEFSLMGLVLNADQTFVSLLWPGYVAEVLAYLKKGVQPVRYALKSATITPRSLAAANKYNGFPKARLRKFLKDYPQSFAHGLTIVEASAKSQLKVGDVVTHVNDVLLGYSLYDMQVALARSKDSSAKLTVLRGAKPLVVREPLYNAWRYRTKRMIFYGGALFYEADLVMQSLYGVPLGSLMVSKAFPGSVFSGVFPALPSGDKMPTFVAVLSEMDGYKVSSLDELKRIIPVLSAKPYFSVVFQDYGPSIARGILSVNRRCRIGYVDMLLATDIPEELFLSDKDRKWISKPIPLTRGKAQSIK